jgi:hypothetical protein
MSGRRPVREQVGADGCRNEALMPGRSERIPRWATEVAILLVIVIAIILVLRGDGESGFWADKPMLASLVADLIVLVLAGTAIERLLRTREELAWRGVAGLACNTIADDISRRVSATLCVLWKDAGYEPPAPDEPREGSPPERLLPEWEVRELPDGRDELAVLRQPAAAASAAAGTLPAGRLAVLMSDADWRRWAARHLRELYARSRPALAQWTPVMLRTPGPRDLLDRAALVLDHVRHLREDIIEDGELEELERRWVALDVQARILTNALWQEAGEQARSFELPDDPENERYWLWRDPKQRATPLENTKAGARALAR